MECRYCGREMVNLTDKEGIPLNIYECTCKGYKRELELLREIDQLENTLSKKYNELSHHILIGSRYATRRHDLLLRLRHMKNKYNSR